MAALRGLGSSGVQALVGAAAVSSSGVLAFTSAKKDGPKNAFMTCNIGISQDKPSKPLGLTGMDPLKMVEAT